VIYFQKIVSVFFIYSQKW